MWPLKSSAAASSNICPLVGWLAGHLCEKKWVLECESVTKTYLPLNLCDSSDSSDSSESCDNSDFSDSSGSSDSSVSSYQKTL